MDEIVEVMVDALNQFNLDEMCPGADEIMRDACRAALTALEKHGYVVAPVEPSEEMLNPGTPP